VLPVVTRARIAWPLPGLLVLGVALPVLAAVVSAGWQQWYASSDHAIMLMRTADVGGRETPLVGAWSRWGWSHPGPIVYWLIAPLVRVLGQQGALVSGGLINTAAIAGSVWVVAWRAGVAKAAAAALVVALVVHTAGSEKLVDIWNPTIAFFPFLFFLFLVWSVVGGDRWLFPVAVAAGSVSVQAHVGYAIVVGGLLVVATVWALVARRGDRTPWSRSQQLVAGMAAAAVLVMWAPVVVEQLTGDPGNLSALAEYGADPDEPAAGWSYAGGVAGWQLRPNGPWLTGQEVGYLGFTRSGPALPAIATVTAVAAATWWAARRRDDPARRDDTAPADAARPGDTARLGALSLVGAAFALVATAQVRGIPVPYLVRWWSGIAALATLTLVWAVLDATSGRVRQVLVAAAVVGLCVTSGITLLSLPTRLPGADISRAIAAVGPTVAAELEPSGRYLIRTAAVNTWGAPGPALQLDLERRGFDVFVEPGPLAALTFGEQRVAEVSEVDEIVTIVGREDAEAGWTPPAGSRLLTRWEDGEDGVAVWASPPV
jgi:hypothetical protein